MIKKETNFINYESNPEYYQGILDNNYSFYSDGSSNKIKDTTKFIGGHGFVFVDKGNLRYDHSNYSLDTTNNRQELLGFLNSLIYANYLKLNEDIYFSSDSQYVIKGISEYIKNWKKNNWVNSSKQEVKNKDIWLKVDKENTKLIQNNKVFYVWQYGHSNRKWNEYVDRLATEATKQAKIILLQS